MMKCNIVLPWHAYFVDSVLNYFKGDLHSENRLLELINLEQNRLEFNQLETEARFLLINVSLKKFQ